MDLKCIVGAETRILDIGAPGPEFATSLALQGYSHYLGLVVPSRLQEIREHADVLGNRFHALTSPSQVTDSSADLLILRRPFRRMLWSARELRHLQFIAVEKGFGPEWVETAAARAMGRATSRITPVGVVTFGDQPFDVLEVATLRPVRPRLYLSEVWGVEGLIRRLNDEGLSYVALRWFETLPDLQPGEDLDLLVADDDLDAVRRILDEEPGTIPVDLYSETGLPGSDFHGAAYFVPDLARKILAGVVLHSSGCRVPSPREHLLSLAYHAVYHKGERSGLPSDESPDGFQDPEHDYGSALQKLAEQAGTELPCSLEGIDDFLDRAGWRPPPDALRRLSVSNPWIERRTAPNALPAVDPPELTVFLVRERTLTVASIQEIRAALETLGFEVLLERHLGELARQRCADLTRGGNWGSGPFAVSGGGPAVALAAVHYGPREPDRTMRKQYPHLTNTDVLRAKRRIRDLIATRVAPSERFNPVHSSDNEPEAWEYVNAAIPDDAAELRVAVDDLRAAYRTDLPVVRTASRGRRAKVEVVQGPDGPAVKKTFAPRATEHLGRELRGLRELGPLIDAVPELLDVGPNWFICPYFENTLGDLDHAPVGRLLPLGVVREMVAVLRQIHELGFDLIDAKPGNFVLDPRQGLKIIDFEFLHSYAGKPPPFAQSYCFVGAPAGFDDHLPVSKMSFDWRWRRFTGLRLDALVSAPPWRQQLERAAFAMSSSAIGRGSRPRQLARLSRARLRRSRETVAGPYRRWARGRALASASDALRVEHGRPQRRAARQHGGER